MIRLKNGKEIHYQDDFDQFFMSLLEAIVHESRKATNTTRNAVANNDEDNQRFIKEVMDNCIFVTHQLFDIARDNEDLSRFMVTGFIFNSIMLTLTHNTMGESEPDNPDGDDGTLH